MTHRLAKNAGLLVVGFLLMFGPDLALGDGPGSDVDLLQMKQEIRQIRAYEQHEDQRVKAERARQEKLVEELEERVKRVEDANRKLASTNELLQASQKAQRETSQKLDTLQARDETLEAEIQSGPEPSSVSSFFSNYLGGHTFTVAGAAGVNFIYDRQPSALPGMAHQSANTFTMDWEPLILYRPLDWILFEGVFGAQFASDGSTGVSASTMDFQVYLNDYAELVMGLFDQPFGDWYEAQSPMWVNRFVTAPLPLGAEPIVPPEEIGVQLRGGLQWGDVGQDFDYALWTGNGPNYTAPVPGAALNGLTGVTSSQTNGKALGLRLRFYPLPVDANLGRLELGASTLNGKWLDGNWYNAWGVDFSYFKGSLQTRGEWMTSYRQMPGASADNRQGWYLQAGYFLHGVQVPGLGQQLNDYLGRLEPLVRYSGVNQRAVLQEDVGAFPGGPTLVGANVPGFGFNGSPALFAPHSREVALALDYWIAPSIVWQNEVDLELPRSGGLLTSAAGGEPVPIGATPNDTAVISQFTIGF